MSVTAARRGGVTRACSVCVCVCVPKKRSKQWHNRKLRVISPRLLWPWSYHMPVCLRSHQGPSVAHTSSSVSGDVHYFNSRPSAENLKCAPASLPAVDLLLHQVHAIGSVLSWAHHWKMTTDCICFSFFVKFTDFTKTAEIFLMCCRSWRWNSNQELMEMSHPGPGFWQLESSFTTIVPVSPQQRCCLRNM